MTEIITSGIVPSSITSRIPADEITMMLDGLNGQAARVAPCLASSDPAPSKAQLDEARLVLVGALRRWADAAPGAITQQTAGPFSQTVDTRQRTGYSLWPSEIERLQDICADGGKSGDAFSFNIGGPATSHLPWCDLVLGATTCSCGVSLTGSYPIYETDGY